MYLSKSICQHHIEALTCQLRLFIAISIDADGKEGLQTFQAMVPELVSGDLERITAALHCLIEMLTGPQGSIRPFPESLFTPEPDNVDNIPSL